MWIEKTKKGLRLCERFEGLDGRIHRASVPLPKNTAQAKKAAAQALAEKMAQRAAGCTFRSFYGLMSDYLRRRELKPGTAANYASAFSAVKKIVPDLSADKLSAPLLKRLLYESEKPARTLNRYILILNCFFKWAFEFGYVPEPVKLSFFKEKAPRRDPSLEYLERSELADVLSQLDGSPYYWICKFLALTGCRIGEAAALLPDDVGPKYIQITKTVSRAQGVTSPKTPSSVREIFIQPELREFLARYNEWRRLYIMAHKIRPATLFFNCCGGYAHSGDVINHLNRVKSTKHLHPHIFRHSHVAILAEQGVDLDAIARRLGHASSSITRAIYYHVTEKQKARDEMALEAVRIV